MQTLAKPNAASRPQKYSKAYLIPQLNRWRFIQAKFFLVISRCLDIKPVLLRYQTNNKYTSFFYLNLNNMKTTDITSQSPKKAATGGRTAPTKLQDIEALITNDLEKRIVEAFEVFDHAGNKTVDIREVGTIIRSLGCIPTEAEIQEIIVNVEDQETSGSVHLFKFLPHVAAEISEYKMQPASAEELLKAFQTIDKDNKGFITKEYMEKIIMEEGEPFTKEEVDEMMTVAVDPDSGHVNYEYYINQIMVNVEPNIYSLIPPPEEKAKRELGAGLL